MRQPARRTSWAAAATLAAILLTTACSGGGDDEPAPRSAASTSEAPAPAEVVTEVTFGKLTGRLPVRSRQALAVRVRRVVDGWLDAAYVGGDYPRTDFGGSFPRFTAGAQVQARRDAALMTNKDIGARIDGVEAVRRSARLDVVSVRRKPVGVTARVALRFRTTGDTEEVVTVRARLYLTPGKGGWHVFGYDVRKVTA